MCELFIWMYLLSFVRCEIEIEDIIIPNYNSEGGQVDNLKTKFKINRRKNQVKNNRIRFLDRYLSNETVYSDGVAHHEIDKSNNDIKLIKKIETELRNIIGMKGVKHIYKRDTSWRTWREVEDESGKKIICYKCQNVIKSNCSNCRSGGYWVIEEKPPPCPYELLSLHNENDICAANYTQFKNIKSACPGFIKFSDLVVNCDNPIETKYLIQRDFKAVSERYPNVICNRRENCLISTEYLINSEEIIFRIINSTNNIIYSRIMKSGDKNYACVNNCGYLNPETKKVYYTEKPLVLNLFDRKSFKKKRENNKIMNNIGMKTKKSPHINKLYSILDNKNKIHKLLYQYNEKSINVDHRQEIKNVDNSKLRITSIEVTTLSSCKRLEKMKEKLEDYSETSDYDF